MVNDLTAQTTAALADPRPGMLFGEAQGGPDHAIAILAVVGSKLWIREGSRGADQIIERDEFAKSLRYTTVLPGYHANYLTTVKI